MAHHGVRERRIGEESWGKCDSLPDTRERHLWDCIFASRAKSYPLVFHSLTLLLGGRPASVYGSSPWPRRCRRFPPRDPRDQPSVDAGEGRGMRWGVGVSVRLSCTAPSAVTAWRDSGGVCTKVQHACRCRSA